MLLAHPVLSEIQRYEVSKRIEQGLPVEHSESDLAPYIASFDTQEERVIRHWPYVVGFIGVIILLIIAFFVSTKFLNYEHPTPVENKQGS